MVPFSVNIEKFSACITKGEAVLDDESCKKKKKNRHKEESIERMSVNLSSNGERQGIHKLGCYHIRVSITNIQGLGKKTKETNHKALCF